MCKCGSREVADAQGHFACWRCYTELLEGKNALTKENQALCAEIDALRQSLDLQVLGRIA